MNGGNHERDRYYPDGDRTLSTAILEAIETHKDEDITKANFQLYDAIDPDALNNLFQKHTTADTALEFTVDDVTVTLRENRAIDIQITSQDKDV